MLNQSINTSLINHELVSDKKHRHDLITNKEIKMISELKEQLLCCEQFLFSVAFITKSGLSQLKYELKVLENKGIKGRIITGDYLGFTQPDALRDFMKYSNIELKMYSGNNMHAKGYMFKHGDIWTMYVGSSNLTQTALNINKEWNLKFSSHEDGEIVNKMLVEFEYLFDSCVKIEEVIDTYEEYYLEKKTSIKLPRNAITPNVMQREALVNIENTRHLKRGLLISATGTGKTILSAFDVQRFNPKRLLFLVHQENIARKALETFKVLMPKKDIGYYEGDYMFCTIQTMSKDSHMGKFSKDYFEYIIIDEVHRSGAISYQKIIDYFTPKYLLGMTATPERGDGVNIFEIFNYNVVHEIRLKDAMEGDMLCPFHYFGISEYKVDGELIGDKSKFKDLLSTKRIDHIIENSQYYSYSGDFMSCLVFVSSVDEGFEMANLFNLRNEKAVFLSGNDDAGKREKIIKLFESGFYNYIITVNIFNEGIDIPCVNQIIMLRPTKSAIIYIQQLGRGLRKFNNKKYVVVLDFIGNYDTSFMNVMALSQNNSGEKDELLKFIVSPNDFVVGCSSVTFDQVTVNHLYKHISSKKIVKKREIKEEFDNLLYRLNRMPLLSDFLLNELSSPRIILKEYSSVSKFYDAMGYDVEVCDEVEFLARFFICPKRVHEHEIIKCVMKGLDDIEKINLFIEKKYNIVDQMSTTLNAYMHLTKGIFTSFSEYKKFPSVIDGGLTFEDVYLDDILKCQEIFLADNKQFLSGLVVGESYFKYESCLYGLVDFNNGYQLKGFNHYEEIDEVYAYVNFTDESSFTSYDNELIDDKSFVYFSRKSKNLYIESKAEYLMAHNLVTIRFFAKKGGSVSYFYLGEVSKTKSALEVVEKFNDSESSVVKYVFELKESVKKDLYNYLGRKND